jgi:hypothetical protein
VDWVRFKWPIGGAAFVGTFAVVSYVRSTTNPDTGEVLGLVGVTAVVILAALLVELFMRRTGAKP